MKYNKKPRQAVVLVDLIKKHNLKVGAELGVFKGETTFYLLDNVPWLELIGVDLWQEVSWGDKSDEGYFSYSEFNLNDLFFDVSKKADLYSNLTLLRKSTTDAATMIKDNSLDFVFIDADHTYEGVKQDIEAWFPKVRQGGFVTGHDIHMAGVKKAVTEILGNYDERDNFVWITKK